MEVVECKDIPNLEVVSKKELEDCGSRELEDKIKRAEESCVELGLEIVKKKSEYEALEAKCRALEVEKIAVEEEIKALKRESAEIKEHGNAGEDEKKKLCGGEKGTERIFDLTDENSEENKVFQLMIENKVLECEKKKAEGEVEVWKEKFKELESWVLKLDNNLVLKGKELPLAGRTKVVGLGSTNVDSLEASRITQPSKRIKLEDGLDVGIGLECSRNKDLVTDLVDVSSTYHFLGKGICDPQAAGTPSDDTPCNHHEGTKREKKGVCLESDMENGNSRQARKQLELKEEWSPCKKMAPSTPGGGMPSSLSVINISDSEDERDITPSHIVLPTDNQESRKVFVPSECVLSETVGCEKDMTTENLSKKTHADQNDEEDIDNSNWTSLLASTPKRKRASNVVTSDSESSDDNIPISKLKRMHLQEILHDQVGSDLNGSSVTANASVVDNVRGTVTPPRRRLVNLRKCGERGGEQGNYSSLTSETKYDLGIMTNKDLEDGESEDVGSDSEGESLGGFIVNSSDISKGNDASSESEEVSDVDVNFDEILSTFQRNKDQKSDWKFEGDMLAAFGKDPELCMKAVCALYRQQTTEEKISKGSLCYNHRGFSKFDALRGSTLAEFLAGGDPNGDLKKTVKELQEYDQKAIEHCRTLAIRYSKQLFEIYNKKEDPLFLPFYSASKMPTSQH